MNLDLDKYRNFVVGEVLSVQSLPTQDCRTVPGIPVERRLGMYLTVPHPTLRSPLHPSIVQTYSTNYKE